MFPLEHILSLNDGDKASIVCPKYRDQYTVIEIRSVFYGNDTCQSSEQSKTEVMKSCQGRNECHLEASTKIFNDSCPGSKKYLNVTYWCQSSEYRHFKNSKVMELLIGNLNGNHRKFSKIPPLDRGVGKQ